MTTPIELAQEQATLFEDELGHIQRLLASWGMLADLSFSDLVLLVPVTEGEDAESKDDDNDGMQVLVVGQMRPNNRPTMIERDLVGQVFPEVDWSMSAAALRRGEVVMGRVHQEATDAVLVTEAVPVRYKGKVIAVLTRVAGASAIRPTSLYERTYAKVFERLASMVADGTFPFPDEDVAMEEAPRVGDGAVVVDAEGRVEFASPNAMNAFHRMGVFSPPEGSRFTELGIEESAVEWALANGRPVVEEVERRPDVVVLVYCIPLLNGEDVTGAMLLLRDVTDVRRLDRLLLSKDAAIREVHHRVKNNLQTISSLLSLQARRVPAEAGRDELREAERRVRSIALVHEMLSRDPTDQIPFDEIVDSLVRMAEDSVVAPHPIRFRVEGTLGEIEADVATPLAVTIAELLQNAVGHAFDLPYDPVEKGTDGVSPREGHVDIKLASTEEDLIVEVNDDGRGLPDGFDTTQTRSLGLSIVRDLVVSQLAGTIELQVGENERGTKASIRLPRSQPS